MIREVIAFYVERMKENKNLKEIGNKKEKNIREDEKEIKTDCDNDKTKRKNKVFHNKFFHYKKFCFTYARQFRFT